MTSVGSARLGSVVAARGQPPPSHEAATRTLPVVCVRAVHWTSPTAQGVGSQRKGAIERDAAPRATYVRSAVRHPLRSAAHAGRACMLMIVTTRLG